MGSLLREDRDDVKSYCSTCGKVQGADSDYFVYPLSELFEAMPEAREAYEWFINRQGGKDSGDDLPFWPSSYDRTECRYRFILNDFIDRILHTDKAICSSCLSDKATNVEHEKVR